MTIEEYQMLDVVRVTTRHRTEPIIGVVQRKYVSGGNPGMLINGVMRRSWQSIQMHVYDPKEVELLWREDSEAE